MMTQGKKNKENLCPMKHPFTRDNGACCLGGTHRIDGSSAVDSTSQPQVVEYSDGKTAKNSKVLALSNCGCKQGYKYDREDGHRCQGGSHFTDKPSDETFSPSTTKGCGLIARNNVQYPTGKCKNGYAYDREEGQRCKGGTHLVNVEQDEKFGVNMTKGDGSLKDQWWKEGAPQCQHKYRYSREGGTRCTGGTHHFTDGLYNPAVHGNNAENAETHPIPHECPDGYQFERENGTRCKGGSHFRSYE